MSVIKAEITVQESGNVILKSEKAVAPDRSTYLAHLSSTLRALQTDTNQALTKYIEEQKADGRESGPNGDAEIDGEDDEEESDDDEVNAGPPGKKSKDE